MSYFVHNVVNTDPNQPVVLMIAPTGSSAFQIGGSTIYSALLLYDGSKNKANWEKKTIMQIKLEYLTLLLTDEINMVGFKKFQDMNQTICSIKGTHDGNWGNKIHYILNFRKMNRNKILTKLTALSISLQWYTNM